MNGDTNGLTMVVPPESPCGCESGKTFGECHLPSEGPMTLVWKNMDPPLPGTGKSVQKCHLRYTNNCGEGISKEHIVSRSVLKALDEKSINFISGGQTVTLSLDSDRLKTKRLCRRHNGGLSRIDNEAARFVRVIQKVDYILEHCPDFPIRSYLFAGFDIERWMLKTLLNVYYARLSVDPQKVRPPRNIPQAFNQPLPSPFGLYTQVRKWDGSQFSFKISKSLSFALITEDDQVTGAAAALSGFELVYLLDGSLPRSAGFRNAFTQRPKHLIFFQGTETVVISMGWIEGEKQDAWISRGDPNAVPPSGIMEHAYS